MNMYNVNMKEQGNNLKQLTKCPLCKSDYRHHQVNVIEDNSVRTVFHLTCEKCQSSFLTFVSGNQKGIFSLGMPTDLSKQEAEVMFKKDIIDANRVLEVYEYFLKNN